MRIIYLMLVTFCVMGQAWGQDGFLYSPDPHDTDFIDNRVENEELYIVDWKVNCNDGDWNIDVGENGPAIYYCENDEWVYHGDILFVKPSVDGITLPFGSSGIVLLDTELKEPKELMEIRAILERCRDALVGIPWDGSPSEGMIAYSDASGDLFWTYPENIALRRDIEEMLGRLE